MVNSSFPVPQLHRWSEDHETARLEVGEIVVWVVPLDQDEAETEAEASDPPIKAMFGDVLSAEEVARAQRLIRPRDRLRFGRCRAAVRRILGDVEGVAPASLKFGAGPHGKPYLDAHRPGSPRPRLEFNVSHSGGLAVVAATRGGPIGVDLERIRGIREISRIVDTFFTEYERAQFAKIPEGDRDAAFMRGWTRKEAILKGLGKGLVGGPANYETMFGASSLTHRFQPAGPNPIVNHWMLWEAGIEEGYVATLAASVDSP